MPYMEWRGMGGKTAKACQNFSLVPRLSEKVGGGREK